MDEREKTDPRRVRPLLPSFSSSFSAITVPTTTPSAEPQSRFRGVLGSCSSFLSLVKLTLILPFPVLFFLTGARSSNRKRHSPLHPRLLPCYRIRRDRSYRSREGEPTFLISSRLVRNRIDASSRTLSLPLPFTHPSSAWFDRSSFHKALLHYTFAALQSHPAAEHALAYKYWAGIGVEEGDCMSAMGWYEAAAERGKHKPKISLSLATSNKTTSAEELRSNRKLELTLRSRFFLGFISILGSKIVFAHFLSGPAGGRTMPPTTTKLSDLAGGAYGVGASWAVSS